MFPDLPSQQKIACPRCKAPNPAVARYCQICEMPLTQYDQKARAARVAAQARKAALKANAERDDPVFQMWVAGGISKLLRYAHYEEVE